MSSYTRRTRALDLSRISYATKSVDHEAKADSDTKKMAEHASENDAAIASELTLDDFGGRSDALGG